MRGPSETPERLRAQFNSHVRDCHECERFEDGTPAAFCPVACELSALYFEAAAAAGPRRVLRDAGPYDGSCLESVEPDQNACGKPAVNAFRYMGGVVNVCAEHAKGRKDLLS